MTDVLASWLLEQVAEDERDARAAGADHPGLSRLALAECDTKRRIIARYVELRDRIQSAWTDYSNWLDGTSSGDGPSYSSHEPGVRDALRDVLRLLALPYVDRPGYRQEWAP